MFSKKTCFDCYFCSKKFQLPNSAKEISRHLSNEDREKLKREDLSFLRENSDFSEYLECHTGRWSFVMGGLDVTELLNSFKSKRCSNFVYYKKAEGMFFPSALEELAEKKDRAKGWVIIIATVSAAVSAVAAMVSVYLSVDN